MLNWIIKILGGVIGLLLTLVFGQKNISKQIRGKDENRIASEPKETSEKLAQSEAKETLEKFTQTPASEAETTFENLKQTFEKNYQQIQNALGEYEKQLDKLVIENEELQAENAILKQKKKDECKRQVPVNLESEKESRKTVTVQIYSAVNKTLCQLAEDHLVRILNERLNLKNINMHKEICSSARDRRGNVPFIVLCVNASRLGTDVNQMLTNVSYDTSVAVVILHHKETHALPIQPSEKILSGGDYKKLGLIVDFAFLADKGMYTCDMNSQSAEKLSEFISKFCS